MSVFCFFVFGVKDAPPGPVLVIFCLNKKEKERKIEETILVLRRDDPALEEEEVFLPALLLDLLDTSLVLELLGPNELGQFILKLVNL